MKVYDCPGSNDVPPQDMCPAHSTAGSALSYMRHCHPTPRINLLNLTKYGKYWTPPILIVVRQFCVETEKYLSTLDNLRPINQEKIAAEGPKATGEIQKVKGYDT